ncbi:Fanconi anemia core complex-associated protein 20 [Fundulus heteroclitus]|uniref:Fanconi anemia core complex-associated protein 20 n=1 Tax=Fundulus heteroclitus TaxID=8078 RepID=UPI00165C671B|nr:Fanconi anemia core complex-associated protein 20 [Fundulus heteroclitus]
MAEIRSKSKLKRKKSSVEDQQSDLCPRGTPTRTSVTPLSRDGATNTDRSSLPAAASWWNNLQPPAVESLWAFTLISALPHLQNQLWDPVPDLPFPPAARPVPPKVEEQWRYDLFIEVPPFPENCPAIPVIPPDLEPQSVSSSQETVPLQSRPSLKLPDRGPPSHSRQSLDQQTEPPHPLLCRSQSSTLHRLEKAALSSAGQPRDKREEETRSRPSPTQLDPPVCAGAEEEVLSVRKHDEEALQSCPMCLHVFPAGFMQMERDSHLAQCLSEMNVDMTW